MRQILLALMVSAAFTVPAAAQAPLDFFNEYNAPWCAHYGFYDVTNCGFYSLQQCRAAISGNGGFCQPNYSFRPPARSRVAPPHRRRHRHHAVSHNQ